MTRLNSASPLVSNDRMGITRDEALAAIVGPKATDFLGKILSNDQSGSARRTAAGALLKRPDAPDYHSEAKRVLLRCR